MTAFIRDIGCLDELVGGVARLFYGDGVDDMRAETHTMSQRFRSPQEFVDLFRDFYGAILKAFEALDDAGKESWRATCSSWPVSAGQAVTRNSVDVSPIRFTLRPSFIRLAPSRIPTLTTDVRSSCEAPACGSKNGKRSATSPRM
jgi:hypothetical protein